MVTANDQKKMDSEIKRLQMIEIKINDLLSLQLNGCSITCKNRWKIGTYI